MSNGNMARQHAEIVFTERLADQSEMSVRDDSITVRGGDAGTFLAPVLERVKSEKGQPGDILSGGMDAENTTLLMEFIAVEQLLKIHWVLFGVYHAVLRCSLLTSEALRQKRCGPLPGGRRRQRRAGWRLRQSHPSQLG